MGYNRAYDMIAAVGFNTALLDHMQHNCYPPIPSKMFDICKAAIAAVADEPRTHITLPNGVTFRGSTTASALDIVRSYHLEAFVDALSNSDSE